MLALVYYCAIFPVKRVLSDERWQLLRRAARDLYSLCLMMPVVSMRSKILVATCNRVMAQCGKGVTLEEIGDGCDDCSLSATCGV